MNIAGMLEKHARDRPDHPAIEDDSQTISHGMLLGFVLSAEANLRDAGVKPGDTVAIIHREKIAHVILMLALARLGAVSHAVDTSDPEGEMAQAIEGLGIRHIIASERIWPLPGTQRIDVASLLRDNPKGVPATAWMFDGRRPLIIAQSSGTTGAPKRAILSHDDMLARVLQHENAVGIGPSDRFLSLLRIDYFSERRRFMAALFLGGTVVCGFESLSPKKLSARVKERRITWMALAPGQIRQLLSDNGGDEPLLPSLRRMYVSSSWLSPEERAAARKRICPNLAERYATNEAGLIALARPEDQEAFPDAVGRLINPAATQVVDDEGHALPAGSTGLLRIQAPYIPTEFLNNPEATVKAFRNGWYYPGDVAVINEQGYLFLKGRSDDVINRGGEKVYPIELETLLIDHPAVSEVAIVGWPNSNVGEVPAAIIVAKGKVSEDELRNYCAKRVASYKVPRHFEFVDALPKNEMGKVLKTELRRQAPAAAAKAGGAAA